MADFATRFPGNPLVSPADVIPSRGELEVTCVLNPGAFQFLGRTGLLLRVAERPPQEKGWVSTPVVSVTEPGTIEILRFRSDAAGLVQSDPRAFAYKGQTYLTTLSHLRLAWSDDGVHFRVEPKPTLTGSGPFETYGVEDCRVAWVDGRWLLTYTAVSAMGVAVGCRSTTDWRTFQDHGLILPPHNKDAAIFEGQAAGRYWCLHRPSGLGLGGHNLWIAESRDLIHWGRHRCMATTRPGLWDEERIGAGASPVKTAAGWLALYHGADRKSRYCLGAMLLDAQDPARVLARSREPIMEPIADYEQKGFFGNVVFSNGHVVDGDSLRVYYGASDVVVCGATFSIACILQSLQ